MKNPNNQTNKNLKELQYIAPYCEELAVQMTSIICQSGPGGTEEVTDIDSEW